MQGPLQPIFLVSPRYRNEVAAAISQCFQSPPQLHCDNVGHLQPIFLVSPRYRNEVAAAIESIGRPVVAARRARDAERRFAQSGASIAVVDERGPVELGTGRLALHPARHIFTLQRAGWCKSNERRVGKEGCRTGRWWWW